MWVYLQVKPGTDYFKRRGQTGPADNPDSYKRNMERKGLKVILSETNLGPAVNEKLEVL